MPADSDLKSSASGSAVATARPWTLNFPDEHTWGFRIIGGEKEIVSARAICFSSSQETRADNEDGVGFPYHTKDPRSTARDEARAAIAEQNANAELIVRAVNSHEQLVAALEALLDAAQEHADSTDGRCDPFGLSCGNCDGALPISHSFGCKAKAVLTAAKGGR